MPAAGRYASHGSKYSWVLPGPPCSSSNLTRGLLPKRRVQTLKVPLGVVIGSRRTPPESRSSRAELSRYAARGGADAASSVLFIRAFLADPARRRLRSLGQRVGPRQRCA